MLTTDIQNILKIDYEYSDSLRSKTYLLDPLNEIEQIGFSIQDLRKIKNILNEISYKNKLNPIEIKERFFQIL